MIRLFIVIVVIVAIVSAVFHVSAGWAWIIVLVGGGLLFAFVSLKAKAKYVTPSAIWKCPYCHNRKKLFDPVCNRCGRGLLVATQAVVAAEKRRAVDEATQRVTYALERFPLVEPEGDIAQLSFASVAGDVLAPNLLAYQGQAMMLNELDPLPETEAVLQRVEAVVRRPAAPDEVKAYEERLRESDYGGSYILELTSLTSTGLPNPETYRLLACVAFLGISFDEAEHLQKAIMHVGPQRVREGLSLDDAVRIEELMEWFGFTCKIREQPSATRHPVVTTQNRRSIPEAVRHEVWRRDEGKCVDCGSRENLEFDHIIPVSKGGSNTARNIELRCESCNRQKAARI